ncbi:MAG: HAD family phosphatase [Oscillospiraceae bacterium]|nr:HAD family phosphatase [Oscillospiraceae bacterium]
MGYRLLASDIDGTLITSKQELTPETLASIDELKAQGKFFTLSTGRPIMGVSKYTHLVSPGVPLISYNGAMIIRPDNGEIVFERGLSADSAREIIRRGNEHDAIVIVWAKNRLFANKTNEQVEGYSRITGEKINVITDQEEVISLGVTKCLWLDTAENISAYRNDLTANPIAGINFCTSTPQLLEFMCEGVSKGEGLRKVCEYCGVDISEAIAAGDELNDLSMIEAAGLGVAMGNAHADIKAAANYITLTNDENGLADMICKYML